MRIVAAGILTVLVAVTSVRAQIPQTLSYQGILTDSAGVPRPDGSYAFTFALYDVATGGNSLWSETRTLEVTRGLFSAVLGTVTPITLSFGTQYWLGIAVGNDPAVVPRVRLTSVAYSHTADSATIAGDIAPGKAVTSINGLANAVSLVAGNNVVITPGSGSITIGATGGGGGGLTLPFSDTINTTVATPAFRVVNSGTGHAAHFRVTNAASPNPALYAATVGTGNACRFESFGTNTSPVVTVYNNSNGDGISGSVGGAGNALSGVGGTNAVYGLGAGGRAGLFEVTSSTSSSEVIKVLQSGSGDGLLVQMNNASSTSAALNATKTGSGSAVSGTIGSGAGNGVFGISAAGSGNAVYGWAVAGTANAVKGEATGTGNAGYFRINNTNSSSAALYVTTNGTGLAADFDGKVAVDVLQINGGSDLAEPFTTTRAHATEPGTVMVIDDEHPGTLTESSRAYDSRVAGIVSGAGGVRPGLTLSQNERLGGNTLVAMAGRVYCTAEASTGEIRPGDLLTTSDIPGHAMKATDRERSHGAILGKAMTGLKHGRGLVLVLVNLQ